LTEDNVPRLIVALKKVTYPTGECLTRSFVRFDMDSYSYNPKSEVFNKILPEIDEAYETLIRNGKGKEGKVVEVIDQFFVDTSRGAVIGEGLRESLVVDLDKNIKDVESVLLKTKWYKSTLQNIKTENRKMNKADPIKYAESVRQLVDVFSLEKAAILLGSADIKLKRSALTALCRVANETPHIKSLIRDKKLKLTIAFELPYVEGSERENLVDQLTSFESYGEQKDFLKKVKECR
jgi:hypothetical protein